jgi:prophage antirepressor-like protein
MTDKTTEQIWVTAKDGAEITGYTPSYLAEILKGMLAQPESERQIQVRHESNRYQIWLPDLIEYVAQYAAGRVTTEAEEIWVNATEAAEITGYSASHLRIIARETLSLPEDQRLIKIRKRSRGYDMWLPDIIRYISQHGHGPYQKPKNKNRDH